MEIVLATRNRKKAEELTRLLEGLDVTVLTLEDLPDCPEVEEDQETFEGNASKKASAIAHCTGRPALADDSGLVVDAIGGAPGVYSARYAGEGAGDAANVRKLMEAMTGVPGNRRTARFVCCIVLAYPNGDVTRFKGTVEGTLGREPRGNNGFGYDPLFFPIGHDLTFAEMESSEKDKLSHRGKALGLLRQYLEAHRT